MPTPMIPTDVRTVEIRLPLATEARLRERAKEAGVPLETYLEELAESDAVRNKKEDPSDANRNGEETPSDANRNGEETPLAAAIRRMTSRTPEQVMADRERILKTSIPGRPLPPGKTLFDVVEGTWPGDETDDEIREALEKIS